MIPFLPALLLILLSGSSGLEKLSQDSRVPARLRALAHELCLREVQAAIADAEPILTARSKADVLRVPRVRTTFAPPSVTLDEGFFTAQRSRDGPMVG